MKAKLNKIDDDLRPQYDFAYSKAVRGKYFKRLLEEGANVVVLEPDVAKAFSSSGAVNEALRDSIDDYLEFSREMGEESKPFSGRFMLTGHKAAPLKMEHRKRE